ncbi:MAG: hypothetical protein IT372_23550, partial [Polyangiaceae bacterium]|nr:hypothetical protein [Polyangiaceae bacterium]
GFTELARRDGFDSLRFGIREQGPAVTVYFLTRFRDVARIGKTSITF